MFDYEIEKLKQNSNKWVVSFKNVGFYTKNNSYTNRVSRATFMSIKQALNTKTRLENKGCIYDIELVPVALYLNIVQDK